MVEIKTGPRTSDPANTHSSLNENLSTHTASLENHEELLNQLTINSSLGITEAALDAITSTLPQPDTLTARGFEMSLPPDGTFTIAQCTMKVELFYKESDQVVAA